ncbi:GNAT family N-acetyltransferase [Citricoccus sp. SGAir0253]|uniref:GNAT family N-acetyltransferase n=1 Tax=Citricoccus sp. SGAir0253 TaxID=2567881 RepID=UPI0010CD462E|nr:GNAT family N-acetyltransferase [Citricoccus sp. SGAir0253]QCU78715.1 GNAT family N-acetyltransferase [Citricoccus sp. SGAir0253]
MPLILRPPRAEDEAALRRMHEQLLADRFEVLLVDGTWEEVLETLRREAAGVDLRPGWVRSDFLVAEVDGIPVGRVSIRHELNEQLLQVNGHVGYAVAPEHRRRGHATEILRQSVARLAALGVERVLVTCDEDNAGSAAVIEANGGVLEDVRTVGERRVRRYWIDAGAPAPRTG